MLKRAALGVVGLLALTLSWTGLTEPAHALTWIRVKNSVNSDYLVRVYRDFTPDQEVFYLGQGEAAVLYNGDGSVRIKIYLSQSIDSYQYYYGNEWRSCHEWAGNDISNPTNDYYDVTIRTFYSGNCDGRN